MFLLLRTSANLVFIGTIIFSLVVIIASIRWIKDLYRMKEMRKVKGGRHKG